MIHKELSQFLSRLRAIKEAEREIKLEYEIAMEQTRNDYADIVKDIANKEMYCLLKIDTKRLWQLTRRQPKKELKS